MRQVRAKLPEQHVVRSLVLWVEFKAVALEALYLERLALDQRFLLRADRKSEDRQAAVAPPELADAPSMQ